MSLFSAGNQQQVQQVLDANLMPMIVHLLDKVHNFWSLPFLKIDIIHWARSQVPLTESSLCFLLLNQFE